jgi:hypothetical protein
VIFLKDVQCDNPEKIHYSSNKVLEKSKMRTANKEFSFRGPIKLLDFGNTDVTDIAGVTDGDLRAVQEVEEEMITNINIAACATMVNISPDLVIYYHFGNDMFTCRGKKNYFKIALINKIRELAAKSQGI